jgi:transposase
VFHWINGKNPRQYGFDLGLWTRQIVRERLAQRFGVRVSLASMGTVLARHGLTPQKPWQRAYQRDPDARLIAGSARCIPRLRATPSEPSRDLFLG